MSDLVPIRRALVSVSRKAGVAELARALAAYGVGIVSTGGTAAHLRAAGVEVTDVAALTGFPEILGGRVKTLHPAIHAAILARRDEPADMAALAAHGIAPIDLVVVDLYPFEETVAGGGGFDAAIEAIDIGGPSMLRGAAKNHAHVTVLTDPEDYPKLLGDMEQHAGATCGKHRRKLAERAFARTAAIDAAVSGWLALGLGEAAPRRRAIAGRLTARLRYGENPHQRAALYADGSGAPGAVSARQVQGKAPGYNTIVDADAAFALVAELDPARPAAVIVKHATPCGAAVAGTLAQAYARAFDSDRMSAFGGIVALNRPLDGEAARAIAQHFTEVVIAPDADTQALAVLAAKPDLRILLTGALPEGQAARPRWRQVAGGFLVQDADDAPIEGDGFRVVTRRAPSAAELADLTFAMRVARHVRSNAVVLAHGGATLGIGGGQTSRLDAARQAVAKAREGAPDERTSEGLPAGMVVASDGFFPFPDAMEVALAAGASAVIQPGGSKNDAAVIAAADAAGAAMVFTGQRHFRH